ncbi:MAG: extracellular solute-binding protein [Lachnospiraceae bacterium]|nr:extracellular solute-binding protein [Lachnospiraceae bacterium]
MKRKISAFLCMAMTLGCLAGCGGSDDANDTKTNGPAGTEPEQQVSGEAQEIMIWHDGDESIMQVIADTANEKLAGENITVKFEKKTGLTDALQLYGNDEANGPDMYLYAHDSLGALAEMGILAPVTDVIGQDVLDGMLPMTVEAGNYKDTQYLMPVYYETLLFMYNKELWEGNLPATTDGLYEYMEAHTDVDAGTYAVVNQHSTAYNVAPFINGFGGYIIDKDGNPGLNDAKTVEAIAYNQKFAALQADGDYNTVTALFNEGKAAAIVGGPWLVSGIRDAGIDLGIASLADFSLPNGSGMAPYSGVQSIGVLKYAAENKKEALGRVLEAIAAPEVGVALANQSSCAPANIAAYDDSEVAANEMIMAMKQTAETATPMPNIPEMSVMWGPAEELLAAVNKSGEDVSSAADAAQEKALTAIEDMQ